MNTHAAKTKDNQKQTAVNSQDQKRNSTNGSLHFTDNRPEVATQRKLQQVINKNTHASLNPVKSSLSAGYQLKSVFQRKILIDGEWIKHYDDTLVGEQYNEVKPYINQWPELDNIFTGTQTQKKNAKENYLNNTLENDIRAMLRKYNEKKSFGKEKDLTRQLIQDVKLKLLGMDNVIGVDQTDGQFSEKADDANVGRTGKTKKLRIYRTMRAEDWENYQGSKDPKDILRGHGGSLGQAMHYFVKSKKDNLDDVLVEFEFPRTGQSLVDYNRIKKGGEGDGPHGGKLTGKNEKNDIMDLDEDIFSINLGKSKELIAELNPKITMIDKVR